MANVELHGAFDGPDEFPETACQRAGSHPFRNRPFPRVSWVPDDVVAATSAERRC